MRTSRLGELGLDPLPRGRHVGEAERDLRGDTGLDEALPLRALGLDAQQRLVHLGDVDAGAHVLLRETPQPATVRSGQTRRIAT
nr:hypothetical protein [Microbacterium barkeri]